MNSTVIKIEDLKIENIRLSQAKVNKKGGKTVYINYIYKNGEEPKKLRFQLSSMKAPFGISGWSIGSDGKSINTPNEGSNDAIELAFSDNNALGLKKLEELEEFIIKHAFDNSKEYFNKKKALDACRLFFTSGIRHTLDEEGGKSDKYPPRFRCKMNKNDDNVYTVQIYDNKKQKVSMDIYNYNSVIPKMSECSTIVECSGWVVGEKFGISFRPAQMKVKKNETSLNDYAFIEEEGDKEDDTEESEHNYSENDLPIETEQQMNNLKIEEDSGNDNEIDPLEDHVVTESTRRRRKA